jgi:hypothetical protein
VYCDIKQRLFPFTTILHYPSSQVKQQFQPSSNVFGHFVNSRVLLAHSDFKRESTSLQVSIQGHNLESAALQPLQTRLTTALIAWMSVTILASVLLYESICFAASSPAVEHGVMTANKRV